MEKLSWWKNMQTMNIHIMIIICCFYICCLVFPFSLVYDFLNPLLLFSNHYFIHVFWPHFPYKFWNKPPYIFSHIRYSEIKDIIDFTLNDLFDELFVLPEVVESEDGKDLKNQFDFELIENNVIPLGEVVAQNFSLALEYLFLNSPSSTTQNIVFSDELNEKNIEDNPFAVLKTLGKKIKSWICAASLFVAKRFLGWI